MRYLALFFTALLCACSSEAVKPMIIGYGMPEVSAWENTAATIANPELLTDGHVSAQAVFNFDFGVGTDITSNFTLAASFLDSPEWTFGATVIRNISGLKAGTKIVVHVGAASYTIRTVSTDRGEVSAYLIVNENAKITSIDTISYDIYYNDVNGVFDQFVTPMAIGEIWFGQTASFDVSLSMRLTYLNNAKIRYSAGGQQWPLLKPIVRQVGVDFTPQTFQNALNNLATLDGIDINTLISRLADSRVLFLAPFASVPFNGKIAQNDVSAQTLADTSFLGQMTVPPTMGSLEKFWKVHCEFGETL